MKKILSTLLPAFSLLALGGCASTSGLSTTESDGVYYSSTDRTTQNARAAASTATQPASEAATGDELTNPDYSAQGNSSNNSSAGSTEYYDDDYAYSSRIRRFHQPYYRNFGYGYNDFVYADPFWYGGPGYYSAWGPGYGYGGYDPLWGPGWGGSYVNINIGFGSPWGWGRPWGWNRWGGGYGRGFYDGYYSGLYGGGYGYGGYGYGGGYGGNYYGNGGGSYGGNTRNVRYGPRRSNSAEASAAGRTGTATGTRTGGRSRVDEDGIVAPNGGASSAGRSNALREADITTPGTSAPTPRAGRGRIAQPQVADQTPKPELNPDQKNNPTRYQGVQDAATDMPTTAPTPRTGEGRRWRVAQDAGNGSQPAPADYSQPRRSRSVYNAETGSGQSSEQPMRRESRQRTSEAPQRTYEAPQRTYEAPSRSSEPSRTYSPPSGGSNDGGSRGGGGGRGRGN